MKPGLTSIHKGIELTVELTEPSTDEVSAIIKKGTLSWMMRGALTAIESSNLTIDRFAMAIGIEIGMRIMQARIDRENEKI